MVDTYSMTKSGEFETSSSPALRVIKAVAFVVASFIGVALLAAIDVLSCAIWMDEFNELAAAFPDVFAFALLRMAIAVPFIVDLVALILEFASRLPISTCAKDAFARGSRGLLWRASSYLTSPLLPFVFALILADPAEQEGMAAFGDNFAITCLAAILVVVVSSVVAARLFYGTSLGDRLYGSPILSRLALEVLTCAALPLIFLVITIGCTIVAFFIFLALLPLAITAAAASYR